jgi:hypothetical protein
MHIAGGDKLASGPIPSDPPVQDAGRTEADADVMGVWRMFWPLGACENTDVGRDQAEWTVTTSKGGASIIGRSLLSF